MTTTTRQFYRTNIANALQACLDASYHPLSLPELADQKIAASSTSPLWRTGYTTTTTSMVATGLSSQGNRVKVYCHKPHWLAHPDHLREARKQGLIDGAAVLPRRSFLALLDHEGEKDSQGNQLVHVLPIKTINTSPSGTLTLEEALNHPMFVPCMGSGERANNYLRRHQEVTERTAIRILHALDEYDKPLGRLLCLSFDYLGLSGISSLDGSGCFVGIPRQTTRKK